MTYDSAVRLLQRQAKELKKVNGIRIFQNGWEYRVQLFSGFAPFVEVARRPGETRKQFRRCCTVDVSACATAEEAVVKIKNTLPA